MLNRRHYYNSRPGGVGVLEVVESPERWGDKHLPPFVPLKHTTLKGAVFGPLASLTVTHVYGFNREQCDQVIEAFYRFPLPGDAAVLGVKVTFGDVEITAALKERQEAEAEYQQARAEGRQAALVTRETPDVFTLAIAGIRPGQDVTVETSYVQIAQPFATGWTLRVPLTIGARYTRPDEQGSPHADG